MKAATPLTDLMRLLTPAGRIPREIPAHYVAWAIAQHRAARRAARNEPKA